MNYHYFQSLPVTSVSLSIEPYLESISIDLSKTEDIVWEVWESGLQDPKQKNELIQSLPEEIIAMKTPFEFWAHIVSNDIIEHLTEQCNKTSSKDGIMRYLGINYFMSAFKQPSYESYWGEYGLTHIKNAMSRNQYEEIRKNFRMNDDSKEENENQDNLFKIRPIIQMFNKQFGLITPRRQLCITETTCNYDSIEFARNKSSKAKPFGTFYHLCDDLGYTYGFEIFAQKIRTLSAKDSAANIVVRLAQKVPSHQKYELSFGQHYTTLPLLAYLGNRGILASGEICFEKIPNLKNIDETLSDNVIITTTLQDIDVAISSWRNDEQVALASNFDQTLECFKKQFESVDQHGEYFNRNFVQI